MKFIEYLCCFYAGGPMLPGGTLFLLKGLEGKLTEVKYELRHLKNNDN